MAEAQATPFTDDEIGEQSQLNGEAFAVAFVAYARTRGEAPTEAARWLGQVLAATWTAAGVAGAAAAMRAAALNVVSLGGELRSFSGDDRRAEASVAGGPDPTILALFDLRPEEADALFEAFVPIGEQLGLRFAWRREGETITMVFTQAGSA